MLNSSELLSNIPGIQYGFGHADSPIPANMENLFRDSLGTFKQVHGDRVVHVTRPKESLGEADAFFTTQKKIVVGIRTADCVPILVSNSDGSTIAAIHAGWRGVLNMITIKTLETLNQSESKNREWNFVLGPSIRSCCYEVSEDLIELFQNKFSDAPKEALSPSYRKLDLCSALTHQLKKAGVKNVELIQACTACSFNHELSLKKASFFSHRRDSDGQRQWSLICRV